MAYPRKPNPRAKRNFRKFAKGFVKKYRKRRFPLAKRMSNTDNIMKLKIKKTGQFTFEEFFQNSSSGKDGSMFYNGYFNPTKNLSASTTKTPEEAYSNFVYAADASIPQNLYQKYRCTCIVMKFTRPKLTMNYGSDAVGPATQIRNQSVPLGTKILHSRVVYKPDTVTNSIQPVADLTPRVIIQYPTSYAECIDDGKTFVEHGTKTSFTRVWKPATPYERRWRSKGASTSSEVDDQEIGCGGIHIRFKSGQVLDMAGATSLDPQDGWHAQAESVILDWTATIYMEYTGRK